MKSWPVNRSYLWERLPFSRLLLPLAAGIALYPGGIPSKWLPIGYVLLAVCFVLLALTTYIPNKQHAVTITHFVAANLFLFFTAWMICYYADVRNDPVWYGHRLQNADGFTVKVTGIPQEKERTIKLEVAVTGYSKSSTIHPATGKAFIYVYKFDAPVYREGDVLLVPNEWQEIKNRGNPFEFDYAAYCARNNIYHSQAISHKEISIIQYADVQDLSWIKRVHYYCLEQLERYIYDPVTLGLLKAILMGDTETLDEDTSQAYADTGIVHIIAISGGHITVFFLFIAFLLGWIRHKKYSWIKYIAALPLVWIYVVVAGAPASAVRAATMFSILGIGFALQKKPNGINQLLAAAFILLCMQPSWLYSIGFQLSFIAVLSILIFYNPIRQMYKPTLKPVQYGWNAIAVSLAAEILVAPLVIYYFHLFPAQFLVANVLAYIFMGIVLLAAIFLVLLSGIYPVAHFIAEYIIVLCTWFNRTIEYMQQWNPASFHTLKLTFTELVLVYTAITTIAIFIMHRKKKALYIALVSLCIFLCSVIYRHVQYQRQVIFVVYNTPKDNYIELLEGKTFTVLHKPEKENPATEQYVISPAHITWQALKEKERQLPYNMVTIGNKKVFILDEPVADTVIHVDYVVLNHKKSVKVAEFKKIFGRARLVIGNNIRRNRAEQLAKECKEYGIRTHYTAHNGAFILCNSRD